MKTDYFVHDEVYKTRKAAGFPGWADVETLQSNLATLTAEFHANCPFDSGQVLELGCGAGDLSIWLADR